MKIYFTEFYRQYVRPHDYEFDEEFMKYGLIPAVFGSLGEFKNAQNRPNYS